MSRYLIGKLGESLVAIWGVVTIVFFVTRLIGDPAVLLLPVGATAEQLERCREALGLDLPVWQQYLHFVNQVAHGDFGNSFLFNRPASTVVLERMPATILLALSAILIGVLSAP